VFADVVSIFGQGCILESTLDACFQVLARLEVDQPDGIRTIELRVLVLVRVVDLHDNCSLNGGSSRPMG
jgi:hypothetical protein